MNTLQFNQIQNVAQIKTCYLQNNLLDVNITSCPLECNKHQKHKLQEIACEWFQ